MINDVWNVLVDVMHNFMQKNKGSIYRNVAFVENGLSRTMQGIR